MARRSAPFTQADITRALKGAQAAGIDREHIVLNAHRDGFTMRFADQPSDKAARVIDEQSPDDKTWRDVDAS